MILIIDIGNTQTKIAVFKEENIQQVHFCPTHIFHERLIELKNENPNVQTVVLASVGFLQENQLEMLKQHFSVVQITSHSPMPFHNAYSTPQTLGIDRRVLAVGASLQFPNQNVLVIDAGTCITYDFVDENNNYQGGGISPGIGMRFKSLKHFTAKLPEINWEQQTANLIGTSTQESIESGVLNGVIAEIDGIIEKYQQKNPNLKVILTGGDAEYLSKQIKNVIFAHSFFLLESLYSLYKYIQSYD